MKNISLSQIKKQHKRECNGCTLCCKLIGVKELNKRAGEWCTHCDTGHGCKIHKKPEQPQECRDFNCLWLLGAWPEEWKPDKTKVVPWTNTQGNSVVLYEDQPGQWRKFENYVQSLNKQGIKVFIVYKNKRKLIM